MESFILWEEAFRLDNMEDRVSNVSSYQLMILLHWTVRWIQLILDMDVYIIIRTAQDSPDSQSVNFTACLVPEGGSRYKLAWGARCQGRRQRVTAFPSSFPSSACLYESMGRSSLALWRPACHFPPGSRLVEEKVSPFLERRKSS